MHGSPENRIPCRRILLLLLIAVVTLAAINAVLPLLKSTAPTLTDSDLEAMHPVAIPPSGHSRAADCRECHRHNHDTWHASYHRTMTQLVTPETATADFDDVRIDMPGVYETFLLHRRDGMPWVTFDREVETYPINKLKRKSFPLLLSTGSHHLQYYWAPSGLSRSMAQLPVVYHFESSRWIPVSASFITPPNDNTHGAGNPWNESCIKCHATFPEMKPTGRFLEYDTTVADFGIACESCHGPGEAHIRHHRESSGSGSGPDVVDPIVNPATLGPELSAQVCGGCHSVSDQNPWQAHRPGQPFASNRRLRTRAGMLAKIGEPAPLVSSNNLEQATMALDNWFWPDGMSRVTGREYNNLRESACHTSGGMTCLDCHRLHQDKDDPRPVTEWAEDQLHYDRVEDQACLKCHEARSYADPAHTHHSAGSSGARCYNCHMPHTTYGLLQAIRTHTITSPSALVSASTGRPTACNLCHLDRPLEWTAEHLKKWYDIPVPNLEKADREVSQVLRTLLEGDAAQRALMAWALSWKPATTTAGDNWIAPYLALLLKDPYPAVRYMAGRSLRQLPGFADFEYDFLAPSTVQASAVDAAVSHWSDNPTNRPDSARPDLLLGPEGKIDQTRLDHHYALRNNREIVIAE